MKRIISKVATLSVGLGLAIGVGVVLNSQNKPKIAEAAATAGVYDKVTNASNLTAGSRVIFVNTAGTFALGDLTATSGGYGKAEAVTISDNKITILATTSVTQFLVEAGAAEGCLAFKSQNNTNFGGQYMSYNSTSTSSSNQLGRYSTNSATNKQAQFNVTYSNNHMVVRSAYNTGRYLRFNNDRFACYYNASGESATGSGVDIWKYTTAPADIPPTSITCGDQTLDVTESLDLASQVAFAPTTATARGLTFAIKSGADYLDLSDGVITGKKSGNAVVTITPTTTSGGAKAIDINITIKSIAAPAVTVGEKYVIYEGEAKAELTGVASNTGTATSYTGTVPSCSYVLTTENGYFENTVAFKNNTKYLALTANSNNLYTVNTVQASSSWIVKYNSTDDVFNIISAAYPTREIRYNASSPRFACYGIDSQTAISLYHYVEKALEDFTIDASASVYKTDTVQIGVTYNPGDASDKTLAWSSNNESIATVDEHGVVTGVAVGTTTIKASKTINSVLVERTCSVTVNNNVAQHKGTETDPFTATDAHYVARGIFTKGPQDISLAPDGEYYVKGLMTAYTSRTNNTLTILLGDNAQQDSSTKGGFEIYQAGKVYGEVLGDKYSSKDDVVADFPVGAHITAVATFAMRNTVPSTAQGTADIKYNDVILAREYAEGFISAFEAENVCKSDGSSTVSTLATVWGSQASAYSALDDNTKAVLTNAEAKTSSGSNKIEKCVAKYDYIAGKYQSQLAAEYDFMGRNPSPVSQSRADLFGFAATNETLVIAVIIGTISIAALVTASAIFYKKKRL